jgi:hypothetical protein
LPVKSLVQDAPGHGKHPFELPDIDPATVRHKADAAIRRHPHAFFARDFAQTAQQGIDRALRDSPVVLQAECRSGFCGLISIPPNAISDFRNSRTPRMERKTKRIVDNTNKSGDQ